MRGKACAEVRKYTYKNILAIVWVHLYSDFNSYNLF